MRRGALSMFDALGFKGIWTRPEVRDEPEKVIAKLRELQTHAELSVSATHAEVAALPKEFGLQTTIKSIFLSDTVVIGAWSEVADSASLSQEQCDWASVVCVSTLTASVVARAALPPAPLVYRGCVAFGEFAIDQSFIVGPAVDAAAEAVDSADAGLVWLAPSAKRVVRAARRSNSVPTHPLLCTHSVPMKGGATYRTWVVSPYYYGEASDRPRYREAVLATFDNDRIDIQVKRQNTAAFLIAEEKRRAREDARSSRAASPPKTP